MSAFWKTAVAVSIFLTPLSARSDPASAHDAPAAAIHMIVTAEPFHGNEVPSINRDDVTVLQANGTLPVTEWVPLRGSAAALELYVLIDERVDPAMAVPFEEIRRFISSQAATTAVGVAYMDDGVANVIQPPTTDHARAAKALRRPSGDDSFAANPFTSLSALIAGWSAKSPRREVLMVTDGVDVFEDVGGANMYVGIAAADAQRAGVQVFGFYAPSSGHAAHSHALIQGGQAFLARIAEETGGEAYYEAGDPSPSFETYLADVASHLAHQYSVTFLATPLTEQALAAVRTPLQRVAFRSRIPNVELIAAHCYYLKTGTTGE